MTAWTPKGRTVAKLRVPLQHGGWVVRTSGSRHRGTIAAMESMLKQLGRQGQRRWDLLGPVADGRITVAELYDAYKSSTTDALLARLNDRDLMPVYREWMAWVSESLSPATLSAYTARLSTLVPAEGVWPRSSLTADAVVTWMASLQGKAANRLACLTALGSFVAFAKERKVLTTDPLAEVRRPKLKQRPIQFLELPDVIRVVDAAEGKYRVLFAVLHAAALEISPALTLTRRHFDVANRALRMPGTKNTHRDRSGIVASWAWPIIEPYLATMLPDAPLFPKLNRHAAGMKWRELTKALGIRPDRGGQTGVRLHDARHHWAVRMLRAGTPAEVVAGQLGHASTKMTLDTYGKFVPDYAELREWEVRANAMDELRAAQRATRAVGGDAMLVEDNRLANRTPHLLNLVS